MDRPDIRTCYAARCDPIVEGPVPKGRRLSTSSADDGQDEIVLKQQRKESQAPERSARTSNIAIGLGTIPVVVAEPGAGRGGGYVGGWGRWPLGAHTADEHGAGAGWWADAEWLC